MWWRNPSAEASPRAPSRRVPMLGESGGRSMVEILVTGGAGFIGSHLCARLLAEGHRVTCADNLLTRAERNIAALRDHPGFSFRRQDRTEPGAMQDLDRLDALFHLAPPPRPLRH